MSENKLSHGAMLALEDKSNKPKLSEALIKNWTMAHIRPELTYTREQADKVCAIVAAGKTITFAARELGLVPTTVLGWANKDVDGFKNRLQHARNLCVDNLVDEIVEIADDASRDFKVDPKTGKPILDYEVVARSKLRIEVRKWIAAVVNPVRYAEKREIVQDTTLRIVKEDPTVIDLEKEEWVGRHSNGKGH